jgi:hypothetical protein
LSAASSRRAISTFARQQAAGQIAVHLGQLIAVDILIGDTALRLPASHQRQDNGQPDNQRQCACDDPEQHARPPV